MRHLARCAPVMLLAVGLAAGCGYGHLHTARPTPRGAIDVTIGHGFVNNKTIRERQKRDGGNGVSISNLPMMIGSRLGLTDRLDIGLRIFLAGGVVADTKINILDPKSRWAISGLVGFGAARDIGTKQGYLVHLPLSLHVSYDFKIGLTPYAAVGYSFYWIYGRDADPMAGVTYLDRAGHGDHLVTVTLGLQQRIGRRVALLLEYNLWQPVVDDPGDFFSFERSHIFIFGFRIRGQIFGRRQAPPLAPEPLPPPIDPGPLPLPVPSRTPGPTPGAPPPPPPPPPPPQPPPPGP